MEEDGRGSALGLVFQLDKMGVRVVCGSGRIWESPNIRTELVRLEKIGSESDPIYSRGGSGQLKFSRIGFRLNENGEF